MTTTPRLWKSLTQVNTSDDPANPSGQAVQSEGRVVGLQDGGYVVVWDDTSRTYNPVGTAIVGQRYDIFGNKVGGEVPISYTSSGVKPEVTLLANGNIAVKFEDWSGGDRDIYVRILDPAMNIIRTDTIDTGANLTFDASIAALTGGGYAVSYTVGSGDDTDIVARIVSPTGVAGGQFDIDNQGDNRNVSALATLSNGNVVVVYEDELNGNSSNLDIKYAIFTPAGTLVTGPTIVPGGGDSAPERDPDVAALRDGGFVVVWTDDIDIRASILANNGSTVAANILVNTVENCPPNVVCLSDEHVGPSVVGLADGGFLVTWKDFKFVGDTGLVRGQRFDASGDKIGVEFTVGDAVSIISTSEDPPDAGSHEAAVLTDGRIAFALDNASTGDLDVMTSIWDPRTLEQNFDGINQSDLLWQHDSGQAAIWLLQDTTPALGGPVGPNVGPSWHLRGSGDFDADGRSDFLWQNDSGQAAMWLTTFVGSGPVGPNPGPSWHVIDAGDFNADNHSDILWQDDSGQAAIWLMNGASVIGGGPVGPNVGPSWHLKAAGDFNGDGQSDLLWQNDSGQAAGWGLDTNGTTLTFGAGVGPNPGPSWHVIDSGDFNGDNKSDILWQNDNGQAAVWLMNGASVIGGGPVGPNPGADWHVVGAGQFNNSDTNSDILWQHDSGQAAVWLMDGTSLIGGGLVGVNPGADWDLIA